MFSLKTHRDLFEDGEEEDEPDEDVLGLWGSLFWLALLTGLISVVCDGLVDAIEGAARATSMSELFITSVILPNVNNAPEHAVAIRLGYNNKVDAVIAIAVGSASQLGLFLLPLGVLLDWARGGSFDLRLESVEAVGFLLAILFATIALQTGKSTWMLGAALVFVYCAIAASWFYAPATYLETIRGGPNGTQAVISQQLLYAQQLSVVNETPFVAFGNGTPHASIFEHVGAAAVARSVANNVAQNVLLAAPMN